jgi:hypothetical protein
MKKVTGVDLRREGRSLGTGEVMETQEGLVGAAIVKLTVCPECERPMIDLSWGSFDAFPLLPRGYSIWEQCHTYGWCVRSQVRNIKGEPICNECEQDGKGAFVCAMCHKEKPSTKIQRQFGDGDRKIYLCSDCFETVSAVAWHEICQRIEAKVDEL